jgi:uncharacterized protein involved in response to NO
MAWYTSLLVVLAGAAVLVPLMRVHRNRQRRRRMLRHLHTVLGEY